MTAAEDALVRRAVAGDVAARNEIVMSMWPFMFGHALRIGRKYRRDANDLAQVGVEKVIHVFRTFDSSFGVRPITYFGWIATQAMLTYARRDALIRVPSGGDAELAQASRRVMSLDAEVGDFQRKEAIVNLLHGREIDPADDAAANEEIAAMRDVVCGFPAHLRQTITMVIAGKTYQEIATVMGVRTMQVKQWANVARRRIKAAMKDA